MDLMTTGGGSSSPRKPPVPKSRKVDGLSRSTRCELCDLPWNQCIHGLESRKQGAGTKSKPASSRPTTSGTAKARAFPKRPDKCTRCGKKSPLGRYWMCSDCLLKSGATKCGKCNKAFKPEAGYVARRPRCRSCRKRAGGSVWIVGSAGSPGLGKRR